MEINDTLVRRLESLAALRLSAEERARLLPQLARILDYVRQLEDLDVSDVPPTTHVLDLPQPLRADAVQPSTPREEMLGNAPEPRAGFYRVPRFVGEDS